nr:hypothetical protein CFP56_28824 [Quercus suber]
MAGGVAHRGDLLLGLIVEAQIAFQHHCDASRPFQPNYLRDVLHPTEDPGGLSRRIGVVRDAVGELGELGPFRGGFRALESTCSGEEEWPYAHVRADEETRGVERRCRVAKRGGDAVADGVGHLPAKHAEMKDLFLSLGSGVLMTQPLTEEEFLGVRDHDPNAVIRLPDRWREKAVVCTHRPVPDVWGVMDLDVLGAVDGMIPVLVGPHDQSPVQIRSFLCGGFVGDDLASHLGAKQREVICYPDRVIGRFENIRIMLGMRPTQILLPIGEEPRRVLIIPKDVCKLHV